MKKWKIIKTYISNYASNSVNETILSTPMVDVNTNKGKYFLMNALIDSGSKSIIVFEETALKLRLSRK